MPVRCSERKASVALRSPRSAPRFWCSQGRRLRTGLSDLTAAFLNWSIFEWPAVDLDEIDVPLRSFPAGTLPTATEVAEMVAEFRATCAALTPEGREDHQRRLEEELSSFDIDPAEVDTYAPNLSLRTGSGTHFVIKPSSDLLPEDIDGDPRTDKATEKATPLRKALLGFSNTMAPGSRSVIRTAFRDHKTDEDAEDLIATEDFSFQTNLRTRTIESRVISMITVSSGVWYPSTERSSKTT